MEIRQGQESLGVCFGLAPPWEVGGQGLGSVWKGGAGRGQGGTVESPQACSPRKLALAALFTSAEGHWVSKAGDRVCFQKEGIRAGGEEVGLCSLPFLGSLCLMLFQKKNN